MNYEDEYLEAMSHDELIRAAKHLRDRIRDGYNFLVSNDAGSNRIRSAQNGQYVSFPDFVEQGNMRERIIFYIKTAMENFTNKL